MTADRVFSLGHGARSPETFYRLLAAWGIRRLVDVRRFPRSRRHPHFSRDALEPGCASHAVEYVWMGDLLGGFREGGYEAHLATGEFARGLERLEQLARERPTAFLCAERDPARCHRRFIARELERRGWEVVHVIDATTTTATQGELW